MRKTEHVGSFTAVADDGTTFEINIFQDFIYESSWAGTDKLPGLMSLKTTDGHAVNRVDKGQYQVVGYGAIDYLDTSSKDANAP